MSVREIMIKGHFLVTLVVSTGQTHNFGNLRPAIPWSLMYRLLIPYFKPSVRESMIKSHWAPGLFGIRIFCKDVFSFCMPFLIHSWTMVYCQS